MDQNIQTITLPMPVGMGRVNCYLIRTTRGFILVDTGSPNACKRLRSALEKAGCTPGSLNLVILTHGDFDHIGNAAWLHTAFGSPLAMHVADLGMAERGDMFASRRKTNPALGRLMRLLSGFSASHCFTPDVLFADEADLSPYGLPARVIPLPGHSRGSIGIITVNGDCICGDLLENTQGPRLNALMDDPVAGHASLETLRSLQADMIYPGHGAPFSLRDLMPI